MRGFAEWKIKSSILSLSLIHISAVADMGEEGMDDFEDTVTSDGSTIDDPVKVYLKEICLLYTSRCV